MARCVFEVVKKKHAYQSIEQLISLVIKGTAFRGVCVCPPVGRIIIVFTKCSGAPGVRRMAKCRQ